MIKKLATAISLVVALNSFAVNAQIQSSDQTTEISNAVRSAFTHDVTIREIVVVGNYALVGWEYGPTGSSATLRNTEQGWVVVTDSMRGWPPVDVYARENGMTIEEAEALYDAYEPNWRQWERQICQHENSPLVF